MGTYRKRVTMDQLLKTVTWGETLQEHLVNGTIATLKREEKLAPHEYHKVSVEKGEGFIEVVVET